MSSARAFFARAGSMLSAEGNQANFGHGDVAKWQQQSEIGTLSAY
jgi:hypothetical protein